MVPVAVLGMFARALAASGGAAAAGGSAGGLARVVGFFSEAGAAGGAGRMTGGRAAETFLSEWAKSRKAIPPPLPSKNPFDGQTFNGGGFGGGTGGGGGPPGGGAGVGLNDLPAWVQRGAMGVAKGAAADGVNQIAEKLTQLPARIGEELNKMPARAGALVNNDFRSLFASLDGLPGPVKKFGEAVLDVTDAILANMNRLKGYDGRLAAASANRRVRMLGADMREASVVGQSYSRLSNESTRLEVGLRDQTNELKAGIADLLASVLELVNMVREMLPIKEAAIAGRNILQNVGDVMTLRFDRILKRIGKVPREIADAIKDRLDPTSKTKEPISEMAERLLATLAEGGPDEKPAPPALPLPPGMGR